MPPPGGGVEHDDAGGQLVQRSGVERLHGGQLAPARVQLRFRASHLGEVLHGRAHADNLTPCALNGEVQQEPVPHVLWRARRGDVVLHDPAGLAGLQHARHVRRVDVVDVRKQLGGGLPDVGLWREPVDAGQRFVDADVAGLAVLVRQPNGQRVVNGRDLGELLRDHALAALHPLLQLDKRGDVRVDPHRPDGLPVNDDRRRRGARR